MNPYVGKICPYCKTVIKEDDDIVVCSKCEMPHHKDCWIDNKGCTTFGCDGTIESIPQQPIESLSNKLDDEIEIDTNDYTLTDCYCPECGSARIPGDMFCGNCGHDFSKPVEKRLDNNKSENNTIYVNPPIEESHSDTIHKPVHSIIEYVYSNTEYYSYPVERIEHGERAPFNWAAFFFDIGWIAYRKMYGMALLFSAIEIAFGLLGTVGKIASFGLKIYIGFTANKMYYNKIRNYQTEEGRKSEYSREEYFDKHKGTSILGLILFLVGLYGSLFLIGYLLGS